MMRIGRATPQPVLCCSFIDDLPTACVRPLQIEGLYRSPSCCLLLFLIILIDFNLV